MKQMLLTSAVVIPWLPFIKESIFKCQSSKHFVCNKNFKSRKLIKLSKESNFWKLYKKVEIV